MKRKDSTYHWFCSNCNADLCVQKNFQAGGTWVCALCGHKNDVSANNISTDIIAAQLELTKEEAKALLDDSDKMEQFLERLERKLSKIPVVGGYLSSIPMMVSLIRSYIKKDYTNIPIGSIIVIVGSLIYFLSPIDLIPDAIPGIGHLDDAIIIGGALKMVRDDIDEYEEWQKLNGKRSQPMDCDIKH